MNARAAEAAVKVYHDLENMFRKIIFLNEIKKTLEKKEALTPGEEIILGDINTEFKIIIPSLPLIAIFYDDGNDGNKEEDAAAFSIINHMQIPSSFHPNQELIRQLLLVYVDQRDEFVKEVVN